LTEEGKPRFPVGKDVRDKYWALIIDYSALSHIASRNNRINNICNVYNI
jgi:hypothetical protein